MFLLVSTILSPKRGLRFLRVSNWFRPNLGDFDFFVYQLASPQIGGLRFIGGNGFRPLKGDFDFFDFRTGFGFSLIKGDNLYQRQISCRCSLYPGSVCLSSGGVQHQQNRNLVHGTTCSREKTAAIFTGFDIIKDVKIVPLLADLELLDTMDSLSQSWFLVERYMPQSRL